MKVKVSIPLVLTLTIATVGLSQSLIIAKTATTLPQANKQELSSDEAEAMQRVNALVEEGEGNQPIKMRQFHLSFLCLFLLSLFLPIITRKWKKS